MSRAFNNGNILNESILVSGSSLKEKDIHIEPRKALDEYILNDSNEKVLNYITVNEDIIKSLFNDDLRCSVCLGTLQTTLATTACLHRFCSECLLRSLRMELGNKEHHDCPSCRGVLPSRRSSKPDLQYDSLVNFITSSVKESNKKRNFSNIDSDSIEVSPYSSNIINNDEIVLDLEKYRLAYSEKVLEFQERARLSSNNPNSNNRRLSSRNSSSNAIVGKQQSLNSSNRKQRDTTSSPAKAQSQENKIWFALHPNPKWNIPEEITEQMSVHTTANNNDTEKFQLTHPYLKLPPHKTIRNMKSYLVRKLKINEAKLVNVEIHGNFQNEMIVFEEDISVYDITTQYWDCKSELILFFQITITDNNSTNINDNTITDSNISNNDNIESHS